MSVGDKIKRMREKKGLTQVELGNEVGVTHSMITQIERGSKIPSLILAYNIALALECTLDDFIEKSA
ncbi:MAG: helix-turn-helix transcriptional regulator [Clostridia bacterium]|nr:helix-turn-helix transcriptional regulator [Clostridia bacterium]